jgi:hypothetical protein
MRRRRSLFGSALAAAMACHPLATYAQNPACERVDFETVVDTASETLRVVNQTNTSTFQSKLRQLKEKRGWTQEQFLKDGAPFVVDDQIAAFNDRSEDLLARINGSGASGGASDKPDCKVLDALRTNMRALVDTQTEKWRYMLSKIDAELNK